jgi:hypothetical protein
MRMCRMSILVRAGRASCPACGSSGSAAVRDEVALPCVTSVSNQGACISPACLLEVRRAGYTKSKSLYRRLPQGSGRES